MANFRKAINIVILVVILNNLACEKQTDTRSHTYDDLYRGRKYFENYNLSVCAGVSLGIRR